MSTFPPCTSVNLLLLLLFLTARHPCSVSWHKQLTQYATKKFFRANAFYNLKNLDKRIQDPDQRLTREVQDLSDSFSQVCCC